MKTTTLLSLATAFALSVASVSAQLSWTTETAVTGASIAGNSPALALGAGGTAGLAYFTSDGEVNYASRTSGGVWSSEAGIANRNTINYLGLSLKLTTGGDPRIAFFSTVGFEARYASRTTGSWSVEDIATAGAAGEYVHLGLASDGTARVAYGANSNSLNYGSRASGSWALENITTNGIPAFLRLGAGDVPFIAMVDSQNSGDLRIYSNPTGSAWTFATAVAGFSGNSTTVSFRLNGSDAALSWVEGGALMFAQSTGGVWDTETVLASGVSNSATSLALDGAGNTYIAFQTSGNDVRVASFNGLAWSSDDFGTGSATFGQGETLDYYDGTLALSYLSSGGDLMYSYATVSAIPEPSTYAAILGLGALGLARWRRRPAVLDHDARRAGA